MLIRVMVLGALLTVASCMKPWAPDAEDRAFVARYEAYCGTPGGGPLGDRTCNAYVVFRDGRIALLSGLTSGGEPIATWRGQDDTVRGGIMFRDWFDDEVERVVGPGEPGYDEAHEHYMNYHVPQAE